MSDRIEEIAARLVVGRKSDGRAVYDDQARDDLVAECRKPGASKSLLARQCGINANQLSRWVREADERGSRVLMALPRAKQAAFVPVQLPPPESSLAQALSLQARLPNGVVLELAGDIGQASRFIQLLLKRLEGERFIWPSLASVPELTVEQLHWLLEGIDVGVVLRHPQRFHQRVA